VSESEFRLYKRRGSIEARPYEHGDQSRFSLSISEADLKRPTLLGGWVARNPDNHDDQWYIAPEYFAKHYGDEVVSEWQPIEAAPRDGTPIDLWHKNGFRITDTWWDAGDEIWTCYFVDEEITHWMPIPAPPANADGAHKESV